MSQSYSRPPSELYGVEGAAGLFLDTGIFVFANWVESEVQEAEQSATNQMFARSNAARAFARCMGDDMSLSSAGFADPFVGGEVTVVDATGKRKRRNDSDGQAGDEILDLSVLVN